MEITEKPKVWEVPDDMTYLVSNSEVSNYLSCERKHYYAHALQLMPINYSTSLSRGLIGHEALAEFYSALKDGFDIFRAATVMEDVVDQYFLAEYQKSGNPGKQEALDMLNNLKTLLLRYVEFQKDDEWEILEVEKSYVLPLFDQYGYGMRLDLLIKQTKGPRAGEIWIVDHKFVYDFYSQNDLVVNAQMPKYLAAVRNETGLVVKGGILNELRHRLKKGAMTNDEMFRREEIRPSSARIRGIMREQILASEEIIERHNLPVDEYGKKAKRVLNQMVCKNCSFLSLCMTELEGESIGLMMKTEYQPNTYGYNAEIPKDVD